jgi:hypothetical protein
MLVGVRYRWRLGLAEEARLSQCGGPMLGEMSTFSVSCLRMSRIRLSSVEVERTYAKPKKMLVCEI